MVSIDEVPSVPADPVPVPYAPLALIVEFQIMSSIDEIE
jgi:hypothetical protein